MKIGIMTWYHYHNYGSVLQAMALSAVVRQMGYEPYLIQYHPHAAVCDMPDYTLASIFNKVKRKLKNYVNISYTSMDRERLFVEFLDQYTLQTNEAETFPELSQLNGSMSAFICGSDQIWAPICFDEKYFLNFVADSTKMIAYAPSIGVNQIENSMIRDRMRELVLRFEHLSVREKRGAELLKELCGKDAKVVLDPTLLLDADTWSELIENSKEKVKLPPEKYLICYFLGNERSYMKTVRKISSMLNLKIYIIPTTQRQKRMHECIAYDVGPTGFLMLLKNSTYICTDSFHGTAFAVNFNIPFTSFKRFSDHAKDCQNSRIYSLLEQLGLESRIADTRYILRNIYSLDFKRANQILLRLRDNSTSFLESALQQAVAADNKAMKNSQPFLITDMCCGCGACTAVCPTNAVSIEFNSQGFWHYKVDTDTCIHCGSCQKVCPYHTVTAMPLQQMKHLYSYRTCNDYTLKRSSSGGAGYEIAALLSQKGYWISGVMYDRKTDSAKHIIIRPGYEKKLHLIQGSKYIQSSSAASIQKISKLSKTVNTVFFGTPCQVAGLDQVLRRQGNRQNAVLVDLICHGVPSQHLINKYLKYIEETYHIAPHPEVNFRAGHKWRERCMFITDSEQNYLKDEKNDTFYAFFRHSLCYMESCYECPYRQKSAGDIRMGDFWGTRFENEQKGISMLLANTVKGNDILKLLPGTLQEYPKQEYWNVQFPINPPKPMFYPNLIESLKDPQMPITELRKKYAVGYEKREKISNVKQHLKKWVRMGRG